MNQNQRTPLIVFSGTLTCDTPVSWTPHGEDAGTLKLMRTAHGEHFFINSPALRSAVRHAAADLIAEMRGKSYHLDDYFLAAKGGIKDAKEESKENAADDALSDDRLADDGKSKKKASAADKARDAAQLSKKHVLKFNFAKEHNPMLMLFGSMDVPGLVSCDHAMASEPIGKASQSVAKFRSVRANDFLRNPDVIDILEPGAIDEFVARQEQAALRSQSKKAAKDLDVRIKVAKAAGNTELEKQLIAEKNDAAAGSNIVQMQQLLNYDAIPAGTKLAHTWRLRRASEIELALFLQGLARWAIDPLIGGHRAHGLGRLSGQWSVNTRRPGESAMTNMGAVQFGGDAGLTATGEIARFLDPDILRIPMQAGQFDFSLAAIDALK